MKCSIISTAAIVAIIPALGAAANIKRQQGITADDLANAVNAWQADTATVSSFLNNAASYTDDATFVAAAQVALNAENDELNHKQVIDDVFLGVNLDIVNANTVLVGERKFAMVVAGLQDMVNNGLEAIGDVDIINANRCANVLPAIDTYFSVVEQSLTISPQGLDIPVPVGGAIRPVACGGPQQ